MAEIMTPYERMMRVYHMLVKKRQANPTELTELTGFKRTDIYTLLHGLIEKGLVERVLVNKRTFYRACDPRVLIPQIDKERQNIESLIALYQENNDAHAPSVRVFEGFHHLEQLYAEVAKANSVVAWFGVANTGPLFMNAVYTLADAVREKKINFKDLIPRDPRALAYAKRIKRLMGPTYSYKVLDAHNMENDILVYEHTVLMIRLHEKNLYATCIHDATFAHMFRTLFDITWKSLPARSALP